MKLFTNYTLATYIHIHEYITFDFCGYKAAGQLQTHVIPVPGNYRLIVRLFVIRLYKVL